MRFIHSLCLKPGMVLSKDIIGFSNNLLLSKDHILTESEIKRLQDLEYDNICIYDGLEDDSKYDNVISDSLKRNAIGTIKKAFLQVDKASEKKEFFNQMKGIVCEIVDEIVQNENATYNITELKNFDDYTYEHCMNVCVYSILLGVEAGLSKFKLYELGLGAILHDIGKMFVPKEILEKKGKLTAEEFEEIKKHSLLGSDYLSESWGIGPEARNTVLIHHERYDGNGYPYGLPAEKQTLLGKIVAITDVYDALTSDRPYRKATLPSEAMEHIMGNMGTLFDPRIVSLFLKKIVPYPVGTLVCLSNGFIGVVLKNHEKNSLRPSVKVISNEPDSIQQIIIYDLFNDSSLFDVTITGVIPCSDNEMPTEETILKRGDLNG